MQPERVFEAPTPSYESPDLPEAAAPEARPASSPAWGLAKRVLFRFAFVYFALYFLPWCVDMIPYGRVAAKPLLDVSSSFVISIGERVFGVEAVDEMTGSGDTTWDYVRLFCLFGIAAAATAVWSILDRKRLHY